MAGSVDGLYGVNTLLGKLNVVVVVVVAGGVKVSIIQKETIVC